MPTIKPAPRELRPVDLSKETKTSQQPPDLTLETLPEMPVKDEDGRVLGPHGYED